MKTTCTYSEALALLRACVRKQAFSVPMNAFQASTLLAVLFERDKEDTLNDIIGETAHSAKLDPGEPDPRD